MNELTNERGFACLGLSLRGRLISIQYAKLLRTQELALAFSQQTQWSALRPLWPIFNPAGSHGQYLKIDSPLESNKLLNPLARRLRLTLHFDYNQLLFPAPDLILAVPSKYSERTLQSEQRSEQSEIWPVSKVSIPGP